MSGYHITPTSTGASRRLRCVAGPGNCKYGDAPHFETKAAADQFLDFQTELEQTASRQRLSNLHSTNPGIEQALRSDLNYKGPKPTWWSKFRDEMADDEDLPCEPELLDVIDSPVGKLAVVWQESIPGQKPGIDWRSQFKGGWGLKQLTFRSMETGEKLAYLKLGYRSKETFARSFGTDELAPFRWQREDDNVYHNDEDLQADLNSLSPAEREALDRRLWLSSWQHGREGDFKTVDGNYIASRNMTEKHIPADYGVIKSDLSNFARKVNKHIQGIYKTYEEPYVDYSNVGTDEIGLQGLGLGTTLYVFGARKLASQGKAIKASGTQTPAAKATWARFAKNFPQQTKPYAYKFQGSRSVSVIESTLLDFR